MPGTIFPPFPDDVATHPLLVIDYTLIEAGDTSEIDKLWEAATELGFWYLKNHGADDEVNGMFEMGEEAMALPMEEKMKFEQGNEGGSFGYKTVGANATDEYGTQDTAEFLNVAKDDALAWPNSVRRTYPDAVNARMDSTVIPFVRKSLAVMATLFNTFNDRLGLPEGELARRHSLEEFSGSEARCIRSPPRSEGSEEAQRAIGSHTDFGSLSFLHNRLGGLQVMVPGTEKWQYVKPISGHAICNLGDAMTIFSGGILRANLHRVVPAPGAQGDHERWSLVFFSRPGNSVLLEALADQSPVIAAAVDQAPDKSRFNTGSTSLEWFSRRIKNWKVANRKGPETYHASRGFEWQPDAV